MGKDGRRSWDERYASGEYRPRSRPTRFLEEWTPTFGPGRALVVACGTGRNALHLAAQGFDVTAVDISDVAIERASQEAQARDLNVEFVAADMDGFVPEGAFHLITVIRYRNPDLWPRLVDALAPDGWILAEHHMKTSADAGGPSSPEFRLDPGELLRVFSGLRIVHYSEGIEQADDGASVFAIQRAVACNGDPGW